MLHLTEAARARLTPVSRMLLITLVVAGCITPIVKYEPKAWSYRHSQHSDPSEIEVFSAGDEPRRSFRVIGYAYVPQSVGNIGGVSCALCTSYNRDYSVEDAVAALRVEAVKRGADAIIGVERTTEKREIPSYGYFGPSKGGYSAYYSGSHETFVGFVNAFFVIWE